MATQVYWLNRRVAEKPPEFPGIKGYTPLPADFPPEQMTYKRLVMEIRHYLTIVEQKQAYENRKKRATQFFYKIKTKTK